jgi:hypothetical protein
MIDASPLDHYDRHELLGINSVRDRCQRFGDLLDDVRGALMATLSADG